MGSIAVSNLGKAYKQYPSRWARVAEWLMPGAPPRHKLHWVLRDINFVVNPGESVGIMGVNGAGKSTLLKMITGTTQPTAGSVRVGGHLAALLELGMGFHPDFTGRQNAFMAGQLMGFTPEEISALMPEIEAFAEIGEYIDQPVRVYSSGMQVRLAFSVATAKRPEILIVDEALSVGDARFKVKCYEKISAYKHAGTTFLLVSHSVGEIVSHCSRAIILNKGLVSFDGNSRDATNVYLDQLFGNTDSERSHPSISQDCYKMLPPATDGSDRYHQRPLYRKEEHRWGEGGAVIIDFKIVCEGAEFPASVRSNAQVDFYFTVRFDFDFDQVCPGLLIKTMDGLFVYGTNSFLASEGTATVSSKAGQIRTFKFSMALSLNSGHYLLSFGVSQGNPLGTLTPLDRRYDSVLLEVTRSVTFWGLADLHSSFAEI
jgi:lipopolysaccharide transport system ATP-binding protein